LLEHFYVVTRKGFYFVSKERDIEGNPTLIELQKNRKIVGGSYVGIMRSGIILYNNNSSQKLPDPYSVRSDLVTSSIVALFFKKDTAKKVFDKLQNREKIEKDFLNETEEVVREIGTEHPVFILSELDPVFP